MTTPTKESLALAREWLEESQQRQWKVKEFSLATLLDRAKDGAIEKCAAVCDDVKRREYGPHGDVWVSTEEVEQCAAEIRALKVTP